MLIGDKQEDARAIPIDLALHKPVKKARKPTEEQEKLYKKEKREAGIPNLGATRIVQLRKALDEDGERDRPLVVAFDGGDTNKTLTNCRWRGAGGRNMQLIVIKPISSTPHKKRRRLLFANPGYLLCSDPRLSARKAIEAYCWRWEIEVGFREQKTQMGMGQAQVRTKQAVTSVLQFTSFVYALLLLAAHKADIKTLPPPKWRQSKNQSRRTTINQLLSTARSELWGRALGVVNKTDFVAPPHSTTKSPKIQNTPASAVIYAQL
jgi:hypothetical protein